MKLATVLLLSSGGLVEWLGKQRAGVLLLIGAAMLGWIGNEAIDRTIGTVGSNLREHEERLDTLESWVVHHDSTVTQPGLAGISDNATAVRETNRLLQAIDSTLSINQAMVHQLYCDRWPTRCNLSPGGGVP